MYLWAIYIFPRPELERLIVGMDHSQIHDCWNWETEHYNSVLEITRPHSLSHFWEYIKHNHTFILHCKDKIPKFRNKYSQKRNIHASVSDLYISTIGLPILLEEICRQILGLYKSLTDTWMWNWGWGRAIPRKGIHKRDFPCSVDSHRPFICNVYA